MVPGMKNWVLRKLESKERDVEWWWWMNRSRMMLILEMKERAAVLEWIAQSESFEEKISNGILKKIKNTFYRICVFTLVDFVFLGTKK